MLISFYTSTPLSEVEQWPVTKWQRVIAHIGVLREKEKTESWNQAVKFELAKRGKK